ncbi:class B sortase [Candidatus Saccharibacteria bacterium]|nr:class B sortase [Candidatus Saccharibacteria bacterium]
MKIQKGRVRARTIISCVIALICVIGIGYSGFKIIEWKIDSDKTAAQTEQINEVTKIEEVKDDDKTEIVKSDEKEDSLYWKYLKTKLIDVDYSELRKINNEVAGWVQVKGTNINYPFVSSGNNDYYLTHSFDKSYSRAGWVFADFRNQLDGSDKNTILYAHGRYDESMFGTLRNILSSGWLNNSDNFIVRTSNEKENALWQVFSVYKIPVTNDYIQTSFNSDDEFQKFAEMLQNRSAQNFQAKVVGTDRILTLSTCFSKTERVVLHAKLIKKLTK